MAKIETGRVVASSLDNFIVFQNQNSQQSPYVSFAIGDSAVGQNVNITIKDVKTVGEHRRLQEVPVHTSLQRHSTQQGTGSH